MKYLMMLFMVPLAFLSIAACSDSGKSDDASAAKMMEQAISLKKREEPLVQVGTPQGSSFEKEIGNKIAIQSPGD